MVTCLGRHALIWPLPLNGYLLFFIMSEPLPTPFLLLLYDARVLSYNLPVFFPLRYCDTLSLWTYSTPPTHYSLTRQDKEYVHASMQCHSYYSDVTTLNRIKLRHDA